MLRYMPSRSSRSSPASLTSVSDATGSASRATAIPKTPLLDGRTLPARALDSGCREHARSGLVSGLITGAAACYSSGTPGGASVGVRGTRLVTDDPAEPASYYSGPGDAPSSLELFLSGVVSCAVLML